MSHLFNNLGHRVATTTKNVFPYIVATLFALYLLANIPSYMSGTLIAGLSPFYWLGAAAVGIIIVLALFGISPQDHNEEANHDHD